MKYQKILIKFTGEAFGDKGQAINFSRVQEIVDEVKLLAAAKVKVAIVCGGGNAVRGREVAKVKQLATDYRGMRATLQNSQALEKLLKQASLPVQLYTSHIIKSKYPIFNEKRVKQDLALAKVLIFAGGTGHPFFTTDTAAVLRGLEIGAQVFIKATKVGGVYSADPIKNKQAKLIAKISYQSFINRQLKVIDPTAVSLAWENGLPLRVVKWEKGNIVKAAQGKNIGSLIK